MIAMLAPYGCRTSSRAHCAIDRWVGVGWRLLERHEIDVGAPPEIALAALAGLRLRDLTAVRVLFGLRGLRFSPEMTLHAFFSTSPFVPLEEEAGTELVGGILLPRRRQRLPGTPAEFREALVSAHVAAVATFRSDGFGAGARLWTETWVRTRGAMATAAFAAYWLAIGPWSAFIRRIFLRAARARAEAMVPPATRSGAVQE